jgi:hypothetical protein
MLEAIVVGWRLEASRSFIQLYFAIIVMFSYAFFVAQHSGSYFKLVLCVALYAYVFINLKAMTIYNDFKEVLYGSETMNEFINTYEAFVKRKDYIKFKSTARFVFIFAIVEFVFFMITLFS